jgi:hypothetical protein
MLRIQMAKMLGYMSKLIAEGGFLIMEVLDLQLEKKNLTKLCYKKQIENSLII